MVTQWMFSRSKRITPTIVLAYVSTCCKKFPRYLHGTSSENMRRTFLFQPFLSNILCSSSLFLPQRYPQQTLQLPAHSDIWKCPGHSSLNFSLIFNLSCWGSRERPWPEVCWGQEGALVTSFILCSSVFFLPVLCRRRGRRYRGGGTWGRRPRQKRCLCSLLCWLFLLLPRSLVYAWKQMLPLTWGSWIYFSRSLWGWIFPPHSSHVGNMYFSSNSLRTLHLMVCHAVSCSQGPLAKQAAIMHEMMAQAQVLLSVSVDSWETQISWLHPEQVFLCLYHVLSLSIDCSAPKSQRRNWQVHHTGKQPTLELNDIPSSLIMIL